MTPERPWGYGTPEPGAWAKKVAPMGSYTLYDAAARMRISVRWVRELIRRHHIPVGRIRRMVKMADGSIKARYLTVLLPDALDLLVLAHVSDSVRRYARSARLYLEKPDRARWSL